MFVSLGETIHSIFSWCKKRRRKTKVAEDVFLNETKITEVDTTVSKTTVRKMSELSRVRSDSTSKMNDLESSKTESFPTETELSFKVHNNLTRLPMAY